VLRRARTRVGRVVDARVRVKNEEAQRLLGVTRNQANHILTALRDKSRIKQVGLRGRHVYYVLNEPGT
jgi:hypothetical protein